MDFNTIIKEMVEHYDLTAMGAVLTFLTILFTFYTQVGVPLYDKTLKPIVGFFHSIYESPTKLVAVDKKLDAILSELKPNGGASLKDQLNRVEASVSISEAQRRLLMDASPHGIWTSDAKGLCTWVNESFRARVGANLEDLLDDNWVNAIHPVDRRMVIDEWENCVTTGRTFNMFYRVVNLKDQTVYSVHGVATPAKSFGGVLVGFNGIIYWT